mgnify:FL=1|tara:strand:- start:136 stop:2388 length:2253 start_codon:yes stop_codon:yes gene_type:complete
MNFSNKYLQFVIGYIAFSFSILEGLSFLIDNYQFNSKILDYTLLVLVIGFFGILAYQFVISITKTNTQKNTKKINYKGYLSYLNIGVTILIGGFFVYYYNKSTSKDELFEIKLPEIIDAFENNQYSKVYNEISLLKNNKVSNPILDNYFEKVTTEVNINTSPLNYEVYLDLLNDSIENWIYLGKSPVLKVRVPNVRFNLKFKSNDNEFTERSNYWILNRGRLYGLPSSIDYNKDKFKIILGAKRSLSFPGLDHYSSIQIGPYLISKLEVTNIEFLEFVQDGGYENPIYWEAAINDNPKFMENEIKKFVGKFGKPGPSNWSYGMYPDGQENFPVTGISWFEAMAYANYRNLSLPNVYQWATAATLSSSSSFMYNSNFSQNQLINVGSQDNSNFNGLYDIAGNVREWIVNSLSDDSSIKGILGGSFNDEPYYFNDYFGQNSMDRSLGNGLRLVKNLESEFKTDITANDQYYVKVRDFLNEKNVSDDVFEIFKSQYDYDISELNKEEKTLDYSFSSFAVDQFYIDAAYNNERLPGYVFYDKNIKKPYKPIIFFPGSGSINTDSFENGIENRMKQFSYLLSEGYALIHPIYKSTFERRDNIKSDYPDETDEYKNAVIRWGKDYKRAIDYIQSRDDMDINSLSYYGISWGGSIANILLAIDDRVKNSVLYVAGIEFQTCKKEVDKFYYTSRIKIPVLMLNGKFDHFFPLETSQIPMFKLLGTPEKDKKHYVYETGHYVPRDELIKLHLEWLAKYE